MARVYKGRQENLDREVAVKVLPPWYAVDPNFVNRFKLEARLVARLSHPNIVIIHNADEENGHLYIVMQLVDGGTLKQRFDQCAAQGKAMDVLEANRIFKQLADALNYAHQQNIIHRDVKPVNVLMDRLGRPILSDFGIAKLLANSGQQLTRTGTSVGTPDYMSPEQCKGEAVDARSDIYALGVMLFEALTGRTPFLGESYPALAHSHIYEMPPRPSSLNPAITPAIEQVVLTALKKEPGQRYQQASDMADALDRAVMQPQAIAQPQGWGQASPPPYYDPQVQAPVENVYGGPVYLCSQCHHPNKQQTRFCIKCGFPLKACLACGFQNPAGNRFCSRCGQALPPGLQG